MKGSNRTSIGRIRASLDGCGGGGGGWQAGTAPVTAECPRIVSLPWLYNTHQLKACWVCGSSRGYEPQNTTSPCVLAPNGFPVDSVDLQLVARQSCDTNRQIFDHGLQRQRYLATTGSLEGYISWWLLTPLFVGPMKNPEFRC